MCPNAVRGLELTCAGGGRVGDLELSLGGDYFSVVPIFANPTAKARSDGTNQFHCSRIFWT